MPYANPPASSASSVTTMTLEAPLPATSCALGNGAPSPRLAAASSPRIEHKRPARHHHRSHSSEPIASTSSFIFVQPPVAPGSRHHHHHHHHSSTTAAASESKPDPPSSRLNGSHRSHSWSSETPPTFSSGSTSPSFDSLPRTARRLKLTALTPAAPSPPLPSKNTSSSSSSSDAATGTRPSPAARTHSQESDSADMNAVAERAAAARSPGSTPAVLSSAPPPAPPRQASSASGAVYPYNEVTPTGSPLSSSSVLTSADEAHIGKPALMVRKKSGELVRPSLKTDMSRRDYSKPRSAPATPMCPKYVHFDTQLEHVKHFIAQQRPAAVSRTGSPIETETEEEPEAYPFPSMVQPQAGTVKLVLPNFPTATVRTAADKDAQVDSIEMTKDGKSIKGTVRVKNLAFEKWVAIRFTLDHWRTVSEVSAEYLDSPPSKAGAQDRFTFTIRLQDLLSRIEDKTMFLAVRYTVGGREIWDNNDGQNYRIEFRRVPTSAAPGAGANGANPTAAAVAARLMAARSGAGAPNGSAAAQRRSAWSVTSAGQAADRMADLRRELDRLVSDDGYDDDETPTASSTDASGMHVGGVSAFSAGAGGSTKGARYGLGMDVRSFSDSSSMAPVTLSGRYDFGNSLKMYAAPNGFSAQTANGTSSGMKPRTQASPRFASGTLPDAASSRPFFDPVSASPERPRAPPLPAISSPPPSRTNALGFTTQIIGGQPATVMSPPAPVQQQARKDLLPDLGAASPTLNGSSPMPSTLTSTLNGGAEKEEETGLTKSYFSPTSPITSEFNHGPPPSWFMPAQQQQKGDSPNINGSGGGSGSQRQRGSTFPNDAGDRRSAQSAPEFSPHGSSYAQLVPPNFRQQHGVFVHPGHMSPFTTPDDSPAPSPPMHSRRSLRSPPPSVPESPIEGSDGMMSPAGSLVSDSTARAGRGHLRRDGSESSTSSTVSSLLSSPESEATSLGGPESPATMSFAKAAQRPNSALEFSRFLDRYRFHLGGDGSENSSASNSPPHDFFSYTPAPSKPAITVATNASSNPSSASSSGANSPTPKHQSPLVAQIPAGGPADSS